MKNPHLMSAVAGLCIALSIATANARTWTNYKGKKIEAEIVKVSGDKVILKFKGREVKFPKEDLCEADRGFIKKWELKQNSGAFDEDEPKSSDKSESPNKPAKEKATAREIPFGNDTLKTAGAINKIEREANADVLKSYSKANSKPTKIKIAIALPAEFDPTQPQKVMWVSAAINNEGERTRGNTGAMGSYTKTAINEGWLVIAADTDIGNPRREDNERSNGGDLAVHSQAVTEISAIWPNFKTWQFACCGSSGGAKASFYRVGDLLVSELNVIGLYLSGCNQDMTEDAREETRCRNPVCGKLRFGSVTAKRITYPLSNMPSL